jgi:hypothetical protein
MTEKGVCVKKTTVLLFVVVGLAVMPHSADANVVSMLRCGGDPVAVDSVLLMTRSGQTMVPTPGFSAAGVGVQDTFLFAPDLPWPSVGVTIWYVLGGVRMPQARFTDLVRDSWYYLPNRVDEPPQILFREEGTGLEGTERDRLLRFCGIRPASSPASGAVKLDCSVTRSGPARVEVFDGTGRFVCAVADGVLVTGEHRLVWDGRDSQGRKVGSGIYLARLVAGSDRAIARIVLTE